MLYIALEQEETDAPTKMGTQESSETQGRLPPLARPPPGKAKSRHV